MAHDPSPGGHMGSCQRCCIQSLGNVVALECAGAPLPFTNAAIAPFPVSLQGDLAYCNCAVAMGWTQINGHHPSHAHRSGSGSNRYSLAICRFKLSC